MSELIPGWKFTCTVNLADMRFTVSAKNIKEPERVYSATGSDCKTVLQTVKHMLRFAAGDTE